MDRQQVIVLARQMYPENTQYLLRHFKEATSKPYRYLLSDLKPTTPDICACVETCVSLIKPNKTEHGSHYPKDLPSKQTHLKPSTTDQFSDEADISIRFRDASSSQTYLGVSSTDQQLTFAEQTKSSLSSGDISSCDDCGFLLENTHDLQRQRYYEDEPPLKRYLISPDETEEEQENKEHEVFNFLMKRAKEHNEKPWDQNTINISKKVYPEKTSESKQRKK